MAKSETVVDNSEPDGIMTFTSKDKKVKDDKRVVLFKIDDEEFTIPATPKKALVMRYLNVARKTNNDLMAAQSLVEELLGPEKWDRFINWDDLDDEVMGAVIEKCIAVAVAAFEDTSKK